jgi:hypothetical protein
MWKHVIRDRVAEDTFHWRAVVNSVMNIVAV